MTERRARLAGCLSTASRSALGAFLRPKLSFRVIQWCSCLGLARG